MDVLGTFWSILEVLVEVGVHASTVTSNLKETSLSRSLSLNVKEPLCLQRLIEHDADVNIPNYDGHVALAYAIKDNSDDMTALLLASGETDINTIKLNGNKTPLMWAARKGNVKLMRLFLKVGAQVNRFNNEGNG